MKTKPNPFLRSASLAASIVFCFASSAEAVTQYWSGAGTWNTGLNWSNTSGGPYSVAWNNNVADIAVFEGTGGLVTVGASRNVDQLNFNVTGYTLNAASAVTLTGTGATNYNLAANVTATIGANVTLQSSSTSQNWTIKGSNKTTSILELNGVIKNNTANSSSLLDATVNVNTGGQLVSLNSIVTGTATTGSGSVLNVAGGTVSIAATGSSLIINNTGAITANSSITVSNGGSITFTDAGNTGGIRFGATGGSSSALTQQSGTLNLDGGVVTVNKIFMGGSYTGSAVYNATVNFNGGTLKALRTNNADFLTNIVGTGAIVKSGGAVIDSNTFDITIGQSLLHDSALGSTLDGGLTKNSSGVLTLTGTNTFTGAVTINGGTLKLNSAGALNTTAGSENAVAFGASSTGVLQLNGTSRVIKSLSSNATPGSPVVENATAANITLTIGNSTNSNGTFAGVIQDGTGGGALALTKTGGGTQTLSGANTYTGATNITGGTLALTGSGAINSTSGITINGSGAKLVASGASAVSPTVTLTQGTVDGTGSITMVNVANLAGNTVANGNGGTGTLTIGTLAFGGAATVNLVSAGISAPLATTSLTTNAAGTVTINASAASWTNGQTYDLISYGGGSIGGAGFGQFALGTVTGTTARQSTTFANSGTAITLAISGDNPKWTGLDNGNWQTGSTGGNFNWKLQSAGTPTDFIASDNVLFDDSAAGTTTIDINAANVAPTSVEFNNSTLSYTIGSTGGFGISSGSLTKNGSALVTLSSVNTYTGDTTINAGTLAYGADNVIATGAVKVDGSTAVLSMGSYSDTVGAVVLKNGGSITGSGGTLTGTSYAVESGSISVILGGTGVVLNKTTSGSVALSGANTYTGATNVKDGSLVLSGGNNRLQSTGSVVLGDTSTSGKLVLGDASASSNQTLASLATTGNGGSVVGGNATTDSVLTLSFASGTVTYGGNLGGVGTNENKLALTKDGAGVLLLTGTNSYTGVTTVNAGELRIGSASALNGTSGITVAATGAGLSLNGGITIGSGKAITINGTGIGSFNSYGALTNNGGDNTWAGNVTIGSSGARIGSLSGNLTVSGVIDSGVSTTGLYVRLTNSTTNLTLSNANTYLGDTTFVTGGGAVILSGGSNRLPTGTKLIFGGSNVSGILDLNGQNQQVAGISVGQTSGTYTNEIKSTAAATLTVNAATASSYAGIITGAISLAKSGSDTLTLSGTNTFTGGVSVNAGVLSFSSQANTSNGNLGSLASAKTITLGGGTLSYTGSSTISTNNLALDITANSVLEVTNSAATLRSGGTLSGSGQLTINGPGVVALGLNSTNTDYGKGFTGDIVVSNGGTLSLRNQNSMGSDSFGVATGTTTIQSGGTLMLDPFSQSSIVYNSESIAFQGTSTLTNRLNGQLSLSTELSGPISTAGTLTVNTVEVGTQTSNPVSLTLSGVVSGAGGVDFGATSARAGTYILSNANTYQGATTVSSGTLVLANNSAAGDASYPASVVTLTGSNETHLQINSGITIDNTVKFSSTNASSTVVRKVAASGTYNVGSNAGITSNFTADSKPDTIAKILAGTNSGSATDLTMSFGTTSGASNDAIRRSDVFSLSGTTVISGSQTDTFVIELSAAGLATDSVLGWNQSGTWVNAVTGNTGAGFLAGSYAQSFADFLAENGGSFNAATMLGAFGFDSGGSSVWAVVNHNSEFAAIPEPTSALVGLLIGAGLLRRRRGA